MVAHHLSTRTSHELPTNGLQGLEDAVHANETTFLRSLNSQSIFYHVFHSLDVPPMDVRSDSKPPFHHERGKAEVQRSRTLFAPTTSRCHNNAMFQRLRGHGRALFLFCLTVVPPLSGFEAQKVTGDDTEGNPFSSI
jgi:hypothetical protein